MFFVQNQKIYNDYLQVENSLGVKQQATFVTLSKLVTAEALKQCLQFIYTGILEGPHHDFQVSKKE